MNICKTVTLRTRKIKDGRQLSFYLDYYPGYRDEATMKVIRHESLGIYIYAKEPARARLQRTHDRACGGVALPQVRGGGERALRLLRQGEDERRLPRLLQGKGRKEEHEVGTRLQALPPLYGREMHIWGDRRGAVQPLQGVPALRPAVPPRKAEAAHKLRGRLLVDVPRGAAHRIPRAEDTGEPQRLP